MTNWKQILERLDGERWLLPQDYKKGMRVPGLIFANEEMLDIIGQDQAIGQVANVAFLPDIVKYSMAMPDIHWGYGFPIGGVAAMRVDDGVVSPGGVGFDIKLRYSSDVDELDGGRGSAPAQRAGRPDVPRYPGGGRRLGPRADFTAGDRRGADQGGWVGA